MITSVCLFDIEDPDNRTPIARVRHGDHGRLAAWAHVRHEDLAAHTGYSVPYWERVDCLARLIVEWIQDLIDAGEIPPVTHFDEVEEHADPSPWTEILPYLDYIAWDHVRWHVTVLLQFGERPTPVDSGRCEHHAPSQARAWEGAR